MTKTETPTSTRGRPEKTPAQRQDIRREITRIAMDRFLEGGHGNVSMRAIARDMNSSTSKIYHYYDSKIDILTDLSSIVFDELFAQMEAIDSEGATPHERLCALANCYVRYWLDNLPHYRLVFMVDGFAQPQLTYFVDNSKIAPKYQIFAMRIQDVNDKQLSEDELKLKLDTLVCFMNGIAHSMITVSDHDWADVSAIINLAVSSMRL